MGAGYNTGDDRNSTGRHGNVTLGRAAPSGITERTSISISAGAVKRPVDNRFPVRALFNYPEEEKILTARTTSGALKYDYLFNNKLYGYVGVELLANEFKNLNLRTTVGPGIGYQLWDDDRRKLQMMAGGSHYSEEFYVREGKQGPWHDWPATCHTRLPVQ